MRVVYLNASGQLGGAERCLLELLAGVRAAQPSWVLHLVTAADGPLVKRANDLGVGTTVETFPVPLARLGDSSAGRGASQASFGAAMVVRLAQASTSVRSYHVALARTLRQLRPDLAHSNGNKMHLLSSWAAPKGVPVVWHVHDYLGGRPVMRTLLRRSVSRCAAAITNSRSVGANLRTVCGARLPIHPIHCAVDLEEFSPTGPATDLDACTPGARGDTGIIRIGLVATLAWWKGHETFLRALALLPRSLPVRGYVIGGPIYETEGSQSTLESLRQLATTLGIADRVVFTGFLSDTAAAMRALDVVVHASTRPEPFGLVIAEAMACARAVIVSQAGGAEEISREGEDSLGHAPGDVAALAASMIRLATDASLRSALGVRARVAAEERFGRARLIRELLPVYDSVMRGVS
jgi:glycosyltransferase involved in cell wall biosynthesis